MGILAEERELLGGISASKLLDCGSAYRLLCAIEVEFKALADQMKRFEKAKDIGEIAGVGQIESRIEKIEFQLPSYSIFNKFQSLDSRIDKLEKLKLIEEIAGVGQIESRIEALEQDIRSLNIRLGATISVQDKMAEQIEALESKDRDWEYLKGQTDLNCKGIERLEKREEDRVGVEVMAQPQAPLPCYDRHGKPEGGLEPGDVISHYYQRGKVLGQFCRAKKDEISAYWQDLGKPYLGEYPSFIPKELVTFEFRPKLKEKS